MRGSYSATAFLEVANTNIYSVNAGLKFDRAKTPNAAEKQEQQKRSRLGTSNKMALFITEARGHLDQAAAAWPRKTQRPTRPEGRAQQAHLHCNDVGPHTNNHSCVSFSPNVSFSATIGQSHVRRSTDTWTQPNTTTTRTQVHSFESFRSTKHRPCVEFPAIPRAMFLVVTGACVLLRSWP